jgi:polyphosphate kinase
MSACRCWSALKFVAIVSSNTDEFFMVRVGALHQKIESGSSSARPDGYSAHEVLYLLRGGAGRSSCASAG